MTKTCACVTQAFQLPRQDLALAYCRYVEDQNHTSYQDFVAARNDIALDIAYVKETNTRALVCIFLISCKIER